MKLDDPLRGIEDTKDPANSNFLHLNRDREQLRHNTAPSKLWLVSRQHQRFAPPKQGQVPLVHNPAPFCRLDRKAPFPKEGHELSYTGPSSNPLLKQGTNTVRWADGSPSTG